MISLLDPAVTTAQPAAWLQLLLDASIKGAVMLAIAGLLTLALRRSSAATRHLVWSLALGSALALPLLALALPAWPLPVLTQVAPLWPPAVAPATPAGPERDFPETSRPSETPIGAPQAEAATPIPPIPVDAWVMVPALPKLSLGMNLPPEPPVETGRAVARPLSWPGLAWWVWVMGVAVIFSRLLLGTLSVWWIARRAQRLIGPAWTALARRLAHQLGLREPVTLLKSERVAMPMTWGSLRSVVVLPADAEQWSDGCRNMVLLHELAHVKRRDCLTQTLAQVACALYWFNPLVWFAARRLRVERELACDDHVLGAGTKASDYAGYLVEIASSIGFLRCPPPVTVGMACSQLEGRVRAILDPTASRRGLSRITAVWAGLALGCFVLPLAALRPAAKAAASPAVLPGKGATEQARIQPEAPQPASVTPQREQAQDGTLKEKVAEAVSSAVTKDQPRELSTTRPHEDEASRSATKLAEQVASSISEAVNERQVGQGAGQGSGRGEGQGSGQGTALTAEQLIQMRAAGVTPEYVEALRRAGYDHLSPRQLAEMRIHGVTEQFIKEVQTWGGEKASPHQLVSLKIAGVSAEYVREMKQLGFTNLSINQLAEMSLHGVTPKFVNEVKSLGYDNLSPAKLVEMRTHGVTPEFIKAAQGWGFGKLTADQLVSLKITGLSPEFIAGMKRLGYDNLSLTKLSEMRLHGVSEQFIKEMRELGFDNLTADQLIRMRIFGINADYVRKLRAAGVKNISVNQMIELKAQGIDTILFKN